LYLNISCKNIIFLKGITSHIANVIRPKELKQSTEYSGYTLAT
jgi:hypothetical protein